MSRSRNETERLDRLAGDGKGSGGGLPLPDLFSAFLVELLDNGPAQGDRLTAISSGALEYKASRVMEVWGSWSALTDDVLRQMASKGIVAESGGAWALGEKFAEGKNLVVIPKRPGKNRNQVGVTIFGRDEREAREHSADMRMTATELLGRLRPEGPGIRPVDSAQVEQIRASLPVAGHLYPVLVDRNGHVLDGKHRRAADPAWPERVIKAEDDISALAVARAANMGRPLPGRVAALIDRVLGDSRTAREAQRGRIRAALDEYPDDSHNAIAKRLGISHGRGQQQVKDLCDEVSSGANLSCRHGLTGQGARTDRKARAPRPPSPEVTARREKTLPLISKLTASAADLSDTAIAGAVAADAGLGRDTVMADWDNLAAEGKVRPRSKVNRDYSQPRPATDTAIEEATVVPDAANETELEVLEQMVKLVLSVPADRRAWLIAQLMARVP